MHTAARAASSSAGERSSVSKGSCSERQNSTTPSNWPRAWSGTEIMEWIPYSMTFRVCSGSWARHSSAMARCGTRTGRPVVIPTDTGLSGT